MSMNIDSLMNETEVLTREQYELVKSNYPAFADEFLFHNFWNDTFLNLNVYSEIEKERYDLQKEMGY